MRRAQILYFYLGEVPFKGALQMKFKLYVLSLLTLGLATLSSCAPSGGGDDDETLKGFQGSSYYQDDTGYELDEDSYDFQ
jgi:hypothetical protein